MKNRIYLFLKELVEVVERHGAMVDVYGGNGGAYGVESTITVGDETEELEHFDVDIMRYLISDHQIKSGGELEMKSILRMTDLEICSLDQSKYQFVDFLGKKDEARECGYDYALIIRNNRIVGYFKEMGE